MTPTDKPSKVAKAARVLLADLGDALDTDFRRDNVDAGTRWSRATDAAEAAPTYMATPTPLQMIRAALQSLAATGGAA